MGGSDSKYPQLFKHPDDQKAIKATFEKCDAEHKGYLTRPQVGKFCSDIVHFLIEKHPDLPLTEFGWPEVVHSVITKQDFRTVSDLKLDEAKFLNISTYLESLLMHELDKDGNQRISLEEWKSLQWDKFINNLKSSIGDRQSKLGKTLQGINWKLEIEDAKGGGLLWIMESLRVTELTAPLGTFKVEGRIEDVDRKVKDNLFWSSSYVSSDRMILCVAQPTGKPGLIDVNLALIVDLPDPSIIVRPTFQTTGHGWQKHPDPSSNPNYVTPFTSSITPKDFPALKFRFSA